MKFSKTKTTVATALGLAHRDPHIRSTNIKSYIAIVLGILAGLALHEYGDQIGHLFGHYWYGTECPKETVATSLVE